MEDKVERDARWWRWKYKYQNLLSIDRIYMESITEEREGVGNGARQESSLPFVLLELACQMADIECSEWQQRKTWDGTKEYFKWNTYREHPLVIELRSTDAEQEARKRESVDIEKVKKEMENPICINDDDIELLRYTTHLVGKWKDRTIQTPFIAPELVNDISKYEVQKVSKREYMHHLNKLAPDLRAMLDEDVQADNYYVVVNWVDVVIGGFGTTEIGYLTGLFSLIKRHGNQIFKMRMEQAKLDKHCDAKCYVLNCLGEKLAMFYMRQGFTVYQTNKWDDEQAPTNWNYSRFGRPLLYNMRMDIP